MSIKATIYLTWSIYMRSVPPSLSVCRHEKSICTFIRLERKNYIIKTCPLLDIDRVKIIAFLNTMNAQLNAFFKPILLCDQH